MAIVAGIAVYMFASDVMAGSQTGSADTGLIVVAVREIPANTEIAADMVELKAVQSDAINPYALTAISQAVGKITRYPIFFDEQVLPQRLVEKGAQNGALSYTLADGQRAIAIQVDDVSGVAGYIEKGDYVDVIATVLKKDGTGIGTSVSTCLVENLLVLEAGAKQLADEETQSYTTVTLSATTEEAVKINYATSNGKLRLVLRPVLDNKVVAPDDYSS